MPRKSTSHQRRRGVLLHVPLQDFLRSLHYFTPSVISSALRKEEPGSNAIFAAEIAALLRGETPLKFVAVAAFAELAFCGVISCGNAVAAEGCAAAMMVGLVVL